GSQLTVRAQPTPLRSRQKFLSAATLRRTCCVKYCKLSHGRVDDAHRKGNEATRSRSVDLDCHWLGIQRGDRGTLRSVHLGALGSLSLPRLSRPRSTDAALHSAGRRAPASVAVARARPRPRVTERGGYSQIW